jgi:hypothetical protein
MSGDMNEKNEKDSNDGGIQVGKSSVTSQTTTTPFTKI